LAYYLADRVIEAFMQSDPSMKAYFASKKDRQALCERGIAMLQFKLTPLMYVLRALASIADGPRG
jgi:hypothetical protein